MADRFPANEFVEVTGPRVFLEFDRSDKKSSIPEDHVFHGRSELRVTSSECITTWSKSGGYSPVVSKATLAEAILNAEDRIRQLQEARDNMVSLLDVEDGRREKQYVIARRSQESREIYGLARRLDDPHALSDQTIIEQEGDDDVIIATESQLPWIERKQAQLGDVFDPQEWDDVRRCTKSSVQSVEE